MKSLNNWGKFGTIAGIIGGVIGALAVIGAVLAVGIVTHQAAWVVVVETVAVILFLVLFFGMFIYVFKWAFKSTGIERDLMDSKEKGEPVEAAEAVVIEVHETGVTVNDVYPMAGLTLEVRPQGRAPYRAEVKWLIDRFQIPQFQPGAVIPVLIDPKDPDNVALGGSGPSTPGEEQKKVGWGATPGGAAAGGVQAGAVAAQGSPEQQAEQMLKQNEDAMKPVLASGVAAEATVVSATPLNIFVNGSNPAMKLRVEVHPATGPKFQADTIGVISAASVSRFEPGDVIHVKYDPNDLTKVAIDHS